MHIGDVGRHLVAAICVVGGMAHLSFRYRIATIGITSPSNFASDVEQVMLTALGCLLIEYANLPRVKTDASLTIKMC